MIRFNEGDIEEMKAMRKHGYSYIELARKFKTSKSTAYYHTKNVKVDKDGNKRIQRKIEDNQHRFVQDYAQKIPEKKIEELKSLRKEGYTLAEISDITKVSLSSAKRYLRGIKPDSKIQKYLSTSKVRIISHCLFDGHLLLSRYRFGYGNKSKELIDKFVADVHHVYGLENPQFYQDKGMCWSVFFHSKQVVGDLLKYANSYKTSDPDEATRIPPEILNGRIKWKKAFLRGFWDDEGSVLFYPENRAVVGSCYHKNVLEELETLHEDLGIPCILRKDRKEIAIYKMRDLISFRNKVNFSPEALVSKGIWKGIPKRDVLDMLISSFGKSRV